ncbi:serine/threonine protein phosphatase [Tritrichomonas foetus]|uniref:Serine/threonine-protein phosphatase n=1 Tax=Tritrichomonas foetus TaxID=1144522 RepID=A0A1J4JT42_9EUKA|nr:serine/threonine protein phosphatase [Tritrichomonas foetus]|eukprot:OHT00437.1 serine/threonine protein phosphatase [Tritrichomonas foetus]
MKFKILNYLNRIESKKMKANYPKYQQLYRYLTQYVGSNLDELLSGTVRPNIPKILIEDIDSICETAENIFRNEEILVRIPASAYIIGDLHGHFFDLIRILSFIGLPKIDSPSSPDTNFEHNNIKINDKINDNNHFTFGSIVFLGDLVDRGEFSTETVILAFLLKILFPERVFIIRGNHEFGYLCEQCGFVRELKSIYHNPVIVEKFYHAFSQMPLGALIDDKFLCIHGGIGPNWTSLSQIYNCIRPIYEFGNDGDDEILDSLLWSDPSTEIDYFEPSERGTGFLFGKNALIEFLEVNNLQAIIRGHQCVENGYRFSFDNRLVTVFGASNYCGGVKNKSAVLTINKNGTMDTHAFPALRYIRRHEVSFSEEVNINYFASFAPQRCKSRESAPSIKPFSNIGAYLSPRSISNNKPNLFNVLTSPHNRSLSPSTSASSSLSSTAISSPISLSLSSANHRSLSSTNSPTNVLYQKSSISPISICASSSQYSVNSSRIHFPPQTSPKSPTGDAQQTFSSQRNPISSIPPQNLTNMQNPQGESPLSPHSGRTPTKLNCTNAFNAFCSVNTFNGYNTKQPCVFKPKISTYLSSSFSNNDSLKVGIGSPAPRTSVKALAPPVGSSEVSHTSRRPY